MTRSAGALGLGLLALGGIVACSALVDTSGLAGPGEAADALAPESSVADGGGCGTCVPGRGLLAWWSFEETRPRVPDMSGAGNHGTSHQAKEGPGKVGMGVEITANTCILVPDSPSLRIAQGTALTMMAWARVTGCADTTSGHGIILNKEHTYELAVECNGAGLALQEAVGTDDWAWHGRAELKAAVWQHVAVTWDGTTVRHYVDGQEKDSHLQTGTIRVESSGLGIGCRDIAGDASPLEAREWLAGTIDEVALYGRALTEAELRAYYEATR